MALPNKSQAVFRIIARILACGFFILIASLAYAANSAPQVVSINPSQGLSNPFGSYYFITTYSDLDGYLDIQSAQLLFNTTTSGANCGYVYYNQPENKLYLRNDSNTAWLGGYAPGSANIIENSYAKLTCANTTVTGTGTTLTVKWLIAFKDIFIGTKNSYLNVTDSQGISSGWIRKGSWRINSVGRIISISPTSGTSPSDQVVSLTGTFFDGDGWQDINYVYLIIGSDMSGKNAFYAYYKQNENKLYLKNDASSAMLGGFAPGSNNTIENSYTRLHCASTTVTGSGNNMIVNWAVSFKSIFIGNKYTYLGIRDDTNTYESTIMMGGWTVTVPAPDNPPQITANLLTAINGATAGSMFGHSSLSRDDINGDGLKDIIISAPGSSTAINPGNVYIYFGSDNIDTIEDLILTGESTGGCFGYSMAEGDINQDGYSDIIIGEPLNDEDGISSGKVYIFHGGPSMHNTPDVSIKGQAAGNLFGYSLTSSDINKDGYDDIIIGAPYNSSNGTNTGKVYIYFGGETINTIADVVLTGEAPNDLFGISVASAKNIDGNGNNAVIVGANAYHDIYKPGKAYVYLGGSLVDNIADIVLTGENNGDRFGISVSAGDFNGDGCDDIIVGAERNNFIATAAGKAYIYLGGKNMTNIPSLVLTGESTYNNFGHLVACAGDLNGDGFGDAIVGSPNNRNGTGKVYIYFGGILADKTSDLAIQGEVTGDYFGYSAISAGDINNDGIDELIIGASNNSLNGINSGKAYLYNVACGGQPIRTPDALLDETEAKACKYFYDQILTTTVAYGLAKDTCYSNYSSTAATGFGLTSLCIMASRYGTSPYWTVTPAQAQARAGATLDTLINIQNNQPGQEDYYGTAGFFFHFIGLDGKREIGVNSEVSTVDTALLLAGVISAGKYFGGDIQTKANTIFNAINWNYFLNTSDEQFYHGWSPDYGLIQQTWDRPSDETLLISLLAIASDPTNQDFLESFYGFPRVRNSYTSANQDFYVYNSYSGSLSTYIFAHCWYDFKNAGPDIPQNVQGARFAIPVDWWENSKTAAQANRQFCIDNTAAYSSYSQNDWGLSACFRPDRTYFGMNGAPPREYIPPEGGEPANDGTVSPYGAISTLPFMKDLETQGLSTNLAYQALSHYYNDYYFRLWGPYGPRDSFNQFGKFSTIYAGINLGQIALMIENYRSGLIWNTFMQDPKILQAKNILFKDTIRPVINQFTVTDPTSPTSGYSHSATVNVYVDAYDAVGIIKWLITEIPMWPSVTDFNTRGSSSMLSTYTIAAAGNGLKNLYMWAMDNSNNISAPSSNSHTQIYIDTTSPTIGAVITDGPNAVLIKQLHANWSVQDAESGIIEHQYCITDGAINGPIIRDWTSTGTAVEVTATDLSLIKTHTYYFSVKARNAAGLWSDVNSSAGITLVQSAPSMGSITPVDGSLSEVGSMIPFNINSTDPEGDAMQYKIVVDGQVVNDWNAIPTFNWQTTSQTSGIRQATVYAKDTWGNESFSNISIYLARKTLNAP